MQRIGETAIVELGLVIPQVCHDGYARIYETQTSFQAEETMSAQSWDCSWVQ